MLFLLLSVRASQELPGLHVSGNVISVVGSADGFRADAESLRNILSSFSIEEFYHVVIPLAGYALRDKAYEEKWGYAPSSFSDGYDFMRCLATHLHHKAYRRPENGHITFLPDAARRRKSISAPGAATPVFATRAKTVFDDDTLSPRENPSLHSQDLSDQNLDHGH